MRRVAKLQSLETCDITFHSIGRFQDFIKTLAWKHCHDTCTIRKLRIGIVSIESAECVGIFSKVISQRLPNNDSRLASLRRLSLDGFDLSLLFAPIGTLIPFQSLSHLTLRNCSNAADFIKDMCDKFFDQARLMQLFHLSVFFRGAVQDVDASLEKLFKLCALKSLHVAWDKLGGLPQTTFNAIPRLGTSLRSLSFHDAKAMGGEINYLRGAVNTFLAPCPNLEQIGFQVDARLLDPVVWDTPIEAQESSFGGFVWVSIHLKALPELTASQGSPETPTSSVHNAPSAVFLL